MTRYWVISPYDLTKTNVWQRAWEYDLQNGTIAIGWRELGDVSRMDKSELRVKFSQVYPEGKATTRDCNTIWRFYHEIAPDDVIVARRGTKKVVGIGFVTGRAFYHERRGKERVGNLTDDYYPNLIPVKWEARSTDFPNIEFSYYTMYELPEERYKELIGPLPEPPKEEFVLEKYLEDFIVTNFPTVFKGELELWVDPEAPDRRTGKQYVAVGKDGTEIGKIDILAKERSTGSYVVIELKKGRESDQVVGQTLRYMGWVQDNLCQQGEGVKGLIICKDADERLRYALKPLPGNVSVRFYDVSFRLSDHPS
jgi:restriction system protein